jgi:hypothetical protein
MKVVCIHCNKEKKGIQTSICNHCGRFGKTDRELAMIWWNNLYNTQLETYCKKYFCEKYHGNMRTYESLTGSEIEKIWNIEKLLDNK